MKLAKPLHEVPVKRLLSKLYMSSVGVKQTITVELHEMK